MNFELGKVYSNPYATAFKSQKMIEGEIDHEVKMAQGQLDYIINAANELKGKLGNAEKNIPAWIQDHISKAHSYIHQSNSGYHEYGKSVNEGKLQFKNLKKGDILVGKFPPYKEMEVISSTDKSAKVKSSKGGVVDIYSTNNYELKENSMKLSKLLNENTEPKIITQLRDVMNSGYKKLRCPKTKKVMTVDSYSASAIVKVYDALKDPKNKEKFSSMGLLGMQSTAFKFVK